MVGKGFIIGDLITRGNEIIFSLSDSDGNPRGDCAFSIVEEVGGNVQDVS